MKESRENPFYRKADKTCQKQGSVPSAPTYARHTNVRLTCGLVSHTKSCASSLLCMMSRLAILYSLKVGVTCA